MASEKTLSLLKKLYELAKQGVGGEKENAERMLNEALAKHRLSIEDIDDSHVKDFRFKCKKSDELFFIRVLANVLGNPTAERIYESYFGILGGYVLCRLDAAQAAELSAKFKFYMADFKRQSDRFEKAYAEKHKLFVSSNKDAEDNRTDDEKQRDKAEAYRVANMMEGIETANYYKRIGNENG